MLASYATGLLVIVTVMVAWAGTQAAWREAFEDTSGDPDVLARRGSCHGCICTGSCERDAAQAGSWEENRS